MPIIYFVRHGETDWNAQARLQGQREVDLNARGRVQAGEAAIRLANLVAEPGALDYVASPLGRARETMATLRRALGLDPDGYRLDGRLKELTFGRWEGLTWKEVRARDAAGVARRERDRWNFVPPDGESYAILTVRLLPLLADVHRDVVMVSHGGVARALLACRGGVAEREAPRIDIWQGKVLVVEAGGYRWA